MTNQYVVVSEAMGIAVAAVANPSPIFPYPASKDGGDGFALRRKCLPQLELSGNGGNGRINVWLETMKASSPTQAKAAAAAAALSAASSIAEQNEKLNWKMRHPSALSRFDEITNASKGKQIVMFLDYDGTLSPIVNDPERAFMSDAMRYVLRDVARCFPTAIVSGRCRDKVYSFVRLAELYYAGSHGMDIKVPAKGPSFKKANGKAVLFQPATKFLPMIDKVYKTLLEATKSTPGAKVENNKFCVSVHFRCVDEKRWRALADRIKSVLKEYPKLRLTPGRKVLEIRPIIKWDKGRAMEFLLESLGFTDSSDVLPVYIGDDLTDEDAFKKGKEDGSSIMQFQWTFRFNASDQLHRESTIIREGSPLIGLSPAKEDPELKEAYNCAIMVILGPFVKHSCRMLDIGRRAEEPSASKHPPAIIGLQYCSATLLLVGLIIYSKIKNQKKYNLAA